jgi:hypothetical protein
MPNKTKTNKVRDMKPSKDAKGGGGQTAGGKTAGGQTAGQHTLGSKDQKHHGRHHNLN